MAEKRTTSTQTRQAGGLKSACRADIANTSAANTTLIANRKYSRFN